MIKYGINLEEKEILSLLKFSEKLCLKVAQRLIYLKTEKGGLNAKNKYNSKVIFPTVGKNKVRYSEQESKMLFCSEIEKQKLYYSVETPTEQNYRLTGKAKHEPGDKRDNSGEGRYKSGAFDIRIYGHNKNKIKIPINIELKCKNGDILTIWKDFLKLMVDIPGTSGIFFHTLESTKNGSLHSADESKEGILDKYKECVKQIKFGRRPYKLKDRNEKGLGEKHYSIESRNPENFSADLERMPFLLYAICILNPKSGLLCKPQKAGADIDKFFDYPYGPKNMNSYKDWTWTPIDRCE